MAPFDMPMMVWLILSSPNQKYDLFAIGDDYVKKQWHQLYAFLHSYVMHMPTFNIVVHHG